MNNKEKNVTTALGLERSPSACIPRTVSTQWLLWDFILRGHSRNTIYSINGFSDDYSVCFRAFHLILVPTFNWVFEQKKKKLLSKHMSITWAHLRAFLKFFFWRGQWLLFYPSPKNAIVSTKRTGSIPFMSAHKIFRRFAPTRENTTSKHVLTASYNNRSLEIPKRAPITPRLGRIVRPVSSRRKLRWVPFWFSRKSAG